jgi:NADPH2:quinone reductase
MPYGSRLVSLLPPGPSEAQLRQTTVGVNFIDIQHRSGRYPLPAYPAPIGMEAAGVVEAAGAGVTAFKPSDRVVYSSPPVGAYANRRCGAAERPVAVPPEVVMRRARRLSPG